MLTAPPYPSEAAREELLAYIDATWKTLTRSPRNLLDALADPKLEYHDASGRLNLYVSAREDIGAGEEKLRGLLGDLSFDKVALRRLPQTSLNR